MIHYQGENFKVLSYSSRLFKIPPAGPSRPFTNDDEVYTWIINEWIPKQPDSEELMRLFICCVFNMKTFLRLVLSRPRGGGKPVEAAA